MFNLKAQQAKGKAADIIVSDGCTSLDSRYAPPARTHDYSELEGSHFPSLGPAMNATLFSEMSIEVDTIRIGVFTFEKAGIE